MGSSCRRTLVAWALVVAFPASMLFADPGANAMMYSSGAVVVNGIGTNGTAAVFAGDKIRTADKSAARISMPGSTVVIPSNSALLYAGKSVELNAGQVDINTNNGMAAKVSGLTVLPAANGSARFQIAKLEGAVTIAAERGAVVVSDGETSTVVQEGSTQTTNDEPQAPGPEKKKKKKRGGAVPLPAAGQGAGGVMKAALVGGGTAAGIVIAIKTTGPPESKDRR